MKFVIKSGSLVKLFSGEMKIEALARFLKENFANWNSNNLFHVDSDGDKIMIRMQQDIDAMLAMNPNAQYLKLEVVEEKSSDKEEEKNVQMKKTQKFQTKDEATLSEKLTETEPETQKDINIEQPKPQRMEEKKPENSPSRRCSRRERSHKHHQKSSSDESVRSSSKHNIKYVQELINKKITNLVDERIKTLIPCIKNQLNQSVDSSINQTEGTIKHQGIKCNGCGLQPISGIRYKCLQCVNFNLCERCEDKINHEHNLLKMKKPESKSFENEKNCIDFYKIGRKFFRQFRKGHSSSRSHQRGHSHMRGHSHWKGKQKFGCGEPFEHRIKRKQFKLQAIFGEQPDFKEFILKNSELKGWELIQLYATEKNISEKELQEKTNKMRKQKLSAFYECPESDFDQIVKTYPKLSFRELIAKMKEEGLRTYTGENFKKMREKFRRERFQGSVEKKEERRHRRSHSRDRTLKFDKKKSMGKSLKKQILKEMESLFGEENNREYKNFIKENKDLGKQDIIAKWIEKHTQ